MLLHGTRMISGILTKEEPEITRLAAAASLNMCALGRDFVFFGKFMYTSSKKQGKIGYCLGNRNWLFQSIGPVGRSVVQF